MNIPQTELDSLRTLAVKIKQAGSQAMRTVGHDQALRLEELMSLAAQLETRLTQAGAERPSTAVSTRFTVPLELMDTRANRRKAEKLREAWEAALEVDRERYGEKIGTDGEAQMIEMLLADCEQEIGGPAGRESAR